MAHKASDLHWDLKKPCADCPFTKSAKYHGGVCSSLPEYVNSIEAGRFAHTCHKTDVTEECDGPPDRHGPPQHCAGALMMLLKTGGGNDLQLPLLEAAADGKFNIDEMTKRAREDDNVFTLRELLVFYGNELRKRLRRKKRVK